jgi:hypothetical protein
MGEFGMPFVYNLNSLLLGEDYFCSCSLINCSTAGRSAGAQTKEFRFSLLSHISLECSVGVESSH